MTIRVALAGTGAFGHKHLDGLAAQIHRPAVVGHGDVGHHRGDLVDALVGAEVRLHEGHVGVEVAGDEVGGPCRNHLDRGVEVA